MRTSLATVHEHRENDNGLTTNSQSKLEECHILKLPPEIRVLIYEYATLEQDPVKIKLMNWRGELIIEKENRVQPALAMTCRVFRSECLPLYCRQNTFRLVHHHGTQGWVAPSLGATDQDIRQMKCIEVELCRCGTHLHLNLKHKNSPCTVELRVVKSGRCCEQPGLSKCCKRWGQSNFGTQAMMTAQAIVAVYRNKPLFTDALLRLFLRNM